MPKVSVGIETSCKIKGKFKLIYHGLVSLKNQLMYLNIIFLTKACMSQMLSWLYFRLERHKVSNSISKVSEKKKYIYIWASDSD